MNSDGNRRVRELPRVPFVRDPIPLGEAIEVGEAEAALAAKRRSIREFSSEPVDRQLLELSLKAAALAPSGANCQPWRFVVIGDPELKRKIRLGAEEEEREFYEHRAPKEWLEALAPLGTDANKEYLEIAPWLIVVFRVSYEEAEGVRRKCYYSGESVGIAVGMLIAALNRMGLSTLTHTPAPMGFLNEICGRPVNEKPFVLMPVGYPAPSCTVPDIRRKPIEEVVSWKV